MDIRTHILNVKDGDAIIVELFKEDKSLVIVIDGGEFKYYQKKVKPKLLKILAAQHKKAPDIVVCTHYDSDHIGGLIPLIRDFISNIMQVWIHRTPELIQGVIDELVLLNEQKCKYIDDIEPVNCATLYELSIFNQLFPNGSANLILESISQLKTLIDLIPTDKIRHVYHKDKPLLDWQEISVLGPTKMYFDSLFPASKSYEAFVAEESAEAPQSNKALYRQLQLSGISPCDQLKNEKATRLTSTNKASIVIAIDKGKKRYLYTGDAGVESFKNIPNYEHELKDLHFLKIPHHASDNNISKELIEIMNPRYAYNSGDKYQDDAVLECIADKNRNLEIKSTKTDDDLCFDK